MAKTKCSNEAKKYEQCRKGPTSKTSMFECESQTKELYDCFRGQMKMEPLCLLPFNNAKECLFKTENSQLACKKYLMQFEDCQNNPKEYMDFLKDSTERQKELVRFDFDNYPALSMRNV